MAQEGGEDRGGHPFDSVDWADFFFTRGAQPGGVDVFFIPGGEERRIAELVLLALLVPEEAGDGRYPHIRVLLPRRSGVDPNAAWAWFAAASERVLQRAPGEAEWTAVRKRVEWVVPEVLRVDTVVDAIAIDRPTLTVIVDARSYRADLPGDAVIASRDRPFTEDAVWGAHVEHLIRTCARKVDGTKSLVIVDVGATVPDNAPLLSAIDQMPEVSMVVGIIPGEAAALELAARAMAVARAGGLAEGMAILDASSLVSATQRRMFRIQLLAATGELAAAVHEILQVLDAGIPVDAERTIAFASMAHRSGDMALARSLFSGLSVNGLAAHWLEKAWEVASETGPSEVARLVADRLHRLYPHAEGMYPEMLDRLRALCTGEGERAEVLAVLPGELAEMGQWIADHSSSNEQAYIDMVLEAIDRFGRYRAAVAYCLGCGALSRGWFNAALLTLDPNELGSEAAEFAAWQLIKAIEAYLVASKDTRGPLDLVVQSVFRLATYLARHPTDRRLFGQLSTILEPHTSGDVGWVVLAYLASQCVKSPKLHPAWPNAPVAVTEATEAEVSAFMEGVATRHPPGEPLDRWDIPPELLVPSADGLLETIAQLFSYHDRLGDKGEPAMVSFLVGVTCALARQSSRPYLVLTVMRIYGQRLGRDGAPQQGRNIAETLLELGGDNATHTRLAWFGFGDIYLRGGNIIDGLLGIVCGMATAAPMPPDEAAEEVFAVMRALRDGGIPEMAVSLEKTWVAAMQRAGMSARDVSRAETARLGLRMRRLLGQADRDDAETSRLLDDVAANLRDVLELEDAPLPALVMFGQLLNVPSGVAIDAAWPSLIARARGTLSSHHRSLYDLATSDVTGRALIEFLHRLESAAFRHDVGNDLDAVTLAARRLLDASGEGGDVDDMLLATELLSDIALRRPEGTPGAAIRWWPESLDEPLAMATAVAACDVDIITLALSANHRLAEVRVRAEGITGARLVDGEAFSSARYRKWAQDYPFRYGFVTSGHDNTFFQTMDAIGSEPFPEGPTVYVCDTRLQQLTPNLFLRESTFAGARSPVSLAPSLTWLTAALARRPQALAPPVLWISDANDRDGDNTLNFLTSLLEETANDQGIPLLRDTTPPDALCGAELAIVGAHGGLGEDARFFRVVADEGQTRLTAHGLAKALAGTRVVVLFVCSGGRVEEHHLSPSPVGLPRALVDAGCEVVIGSPWPLDATVPSCWLPAFLDAWNAGATAMEANFIANGIVGERTGHDPAKALAMAVYGNGLARRWQRDEVGSGGAS